MEVIRLFLSEGLLLVHLVSLYIPLGGDGTSLTSYTNLLLFTPPLNLIWFTFKFGLVIAFLILIRGGTPRYRYDFLTKLGWLKFLNLVLGFSLSLIILILLS